MGLPAEALRNLPTAEEFWAMLLKERAEREARQAEQAKWQTEWQAEQVKWQAERQAEQAKWQAEHEKWRAEAKARQEALDKQFAKTDAEIERTMRTVNRVSKNMAGLNDSLGQPMEHMVSKEVWRNFTPLGYQFTQAAQRIQFVMDDECIAEVDFFLQNGEYVMAIEVKTKFRLEFVEIHIERMANLRRYMDHKKDTRKILGAIAGGIMPDGIADYAQKHGLYVLKQNGKNFSLEKPKANFQAKVW